MNEEFDDTDTATAPRSSTPRGEAQMGNESTCFIPVQEVRDLIPQTGVVDHAASQPLPVEDVIPTFNKLFAEMQQMQPVITQIISERGTFALKNGKRVGKEYVEGLEEAMTGMEERLKTAEQENERLSTELLQRKADQENQTGAYHEHLHQMTVSYQQSVKNTENLNSKVANLESLILQLKTENKKLSDSNTELIVEVKDLRVFKDTVLDQMVSRAEERFKEQIADLEKECSNYRSVNLTLRTKLSVSEREKDKLQILCDATQQRRQSLNMGLPSSLSSTSSSSQSESQGLPPVLVNRELVTQIQEMNGSNAGH
jgi:chromosome segregation ATPase